MFQVSSRKTPQEVCGWVLRGFARGKSRWRGLRIALAFAVVRRKLTVLRINRIVLDHGVDRSPAVEGAAGRVF